MSRMTRSRFQHALRFQYKDIEELSKILGDILEAIQATCSPSLITDGSKPFQAVLTKYEPNHIEAQVTRHSTVPPGSTSGYRLGYTNESGGIRLAIHQLQSRK